MLHVLIAEDCPIMADCYKSTFSLPGVALYFADNGVDAWKAFETTDFDMVITDNDMPQMRGIEFIKRIRCVAGSKVPVILCSGSSKDADEAQRFGAGFVYKSDALSILETIKSLLKSKS